MPSRPPTIRSLAQQLGLSRTTTSDALRGAPHVAEATIIRVRKAAAEAGYRENPLATAMMSELKRSRSATFRGVLAAVNVLESERAGHGLFHQELIVGARSRAAELGFKVEEFAIGPAGLSVQRLDSILQSRNIHGILLLPAWQLPDLSKFDWQRYAGIYVDYNDEASQLHCVCSDHYRSVLMGLNRLLEYGYERPGLVIEHDRDKRLQHRISAAFRAFQAARLPEPQTISPLVLPTLERSAFSMWFEKYQPDVVLGHFTELLDWMEHCGARVPLTHGFVSLNLLYKTRPCAGIDLRPQAIGSRSAELLISHLQRNERNLPEWPVTTSISARWVDGPTIKLTRNPPSP